MPAPSVPVTRRAFGLAVSSTAALGTATLLAPQSGAAPLETSACPTGWGSLPERRSAMVRGPVINVRTGRHACYDRLVVDVRGIAAAGYDVRYVRTFRTDGEGRVIPLRGAADLQIVARAPSYPRGYTPRNRLALRAVSGYRTFRQVAWGGSFEGQTSIGLGVRARLPCRVWTMRSGTIRMVVIDVAHRW